MKSIFHLFPSLNYFSLFTFNLFFLSFFGKRHEKKKVRTTEDHFHFFVSLFRDFPRFFFSGKWKVSHERKGKKERSSSQSDDDTVAHFSIVGSGLYREWKKKEAKKSFSAKTKSNRIPTALCKSNWYKPLKPSKSGEIQK